MSKFLLSTVVFLGLSLASTHSLQACNLGEASIISESQGQRNVFTKKAADSFVQEGEEFAK